MGFGGQLFANAWQAASTSAREGAAALSDGAQWVGQRSAEAARYVADRGVEAGRWVADTSARTARQVAETAQRAAVAATAAAQRALVATKQNASELYKAGVATAKATAKQVSAVAAKVKCRLKEARDNGRKHTKKGWTGEAELSAESKVGGVDRGELETKLSIEGGREGEAHFLTVGDDDYLTLGYAKGSAKVGYSHDPLTGQHQLDLLNLEGRASVLHGEAETYVANNALNLKGDVDVLSAAGSLRPVSVEWGDDVGVSGEVGASAVVAQASAEGALRLTPKTIYDNSLGAAVNFFSPGSRFAHLPSWTDYGLAGGLRGEVGFGAAASAEYQVGRFDGFTGITLGAKAGAGPMAGVRTFLGIATPPEE